MKKSQKKKKKFLWNSPGKQNKLIPMRSLPILITISSSTDLPISENWRKLLRISILLRRTLHITNLWKFWDLVKLSEVLLESKIVLVSRIDNSLQTTLPSLLMPRVRIFNGRDLMKFSSPQFSANMLILTILNQELWVHHNSWVP